MRSVCVWGQVQVPQQYTYILIRSSIVTKYFLLPPISICNLPLITQPAREMVINSSEKCNTVGKHRTWMASIGWMMQSRTAVGALIQDCSQWGWSCSRTMLQTLEQKQLEEGKWSGVHWDELDWKREVDCHHSKIKTSHRPITKISACMLAASEFGQWLGTLLFNRTPSLTPAWLHPLKCKFSLALPIKLHFKQTWSFVCDWLLHSNKQCDTVYFAPCVYLSYSVYAHACNCTS